MKVRLPVRKAILERRTYEAPAEGRWGENPARFQREYDRMQYGRAGGAAPCSAEKELAMYPEYQAPTNTLARYFGRGSQRSCC